MEVHHLLTAAGSTPPDPAYVAGLGAHSIERLHREPEILAAERKRLQQQMEALAFRNYRSFIGNNDCVRAAASELQGMTSALEKTVPALDSLTTQCQAFTATGQELARQRHRNRVTLQNHNQLLELLETPQLMDTCVRNGFFEEALQLSTFASKLYRLYPDVLVVQHIMDDVHATTNLLLSQLHLQLRSNIQLPACLKVIGLLRRLSVYTEHELRITFLKCRDAWLLGALDSLVAQTPYACLSKWIDHCRVHLFDIITQYRAIFSDEASEGILDSWIARKVAELLQLVDSTMRSGITEGASIASLLDQMMYFGMSLGRVGVDFRSLIPSIFERHISRTFASSLAAATSRCLEAVKAHRWQPARAGSTVSSSSGSSALTSSLGLVAPIGSGASSDAALAPPPVLLEVSFLASFTNAVLTALNELRQCAPISMAAAAAQELDSSLAAVTQAVKSAAPRSAIATSAAGAELRSGPTSSGAQLALLDAEAAEQQYQRLVHLAAEVMSPFLLRCLQAVFHLGR